jgi:GTP-binding protein YchF
MSGKTALFDALSGHVVDSRNHPARADHPNVATIKVPDDRVGFLAEMYESAKVVHATMELADLPGLILGSGPGAAERPRIIAHLRQADAIVCCLRAFHSDAVPPPKGSVDPRRDYNDIRSEFFLSDLESVVRRIDKIASTLKKPLPKKEREQHEREAQLLERCRKALEAEQPLRPLLERPEDDLLLRSFGFLTQKPTIIVLNVDESQAGDIAAIVQPWADIGLPVHAISAKAESDILELPEDERPMFMEELGIASLQSDRLARDICGELNQVVFLTTGPDETRAWPIPRNSTAVEAAGAIHSDLARGFIRAEVIAYDDLKQAGSEKAVRAAGKFRLEGKDYVVQDGDILVIRFSV